MDLLSSLQVGDEKTIVKAVSFHQNPKKLFGQEVKTVFAALTTEAVLIYHTNGDAYDNILRHKWMDDVVVSATSLVWHPLKAELFVGDEEGHITVFKYEEGDEGTCPYVFNCIYKNEDKVCSLSWSQDGIYLAAAFTHNLVMFSRYRDGFMEKVINLGRGPCDYVVKFHPRESSYLFVGAENNPFLKVFTNLPTLKEHWREIICTGPGGVRAICFDKQEPRSKTRFKSSIVLVTAGKSPRVWSFHGYTSISEPKLCVLNVLDEDASSEGLLNCISFHGDTSRKYIVCGLDNGTFSLYAASSKRNATDDKKMFFASIKKKCDRHEYPPVTCLLPHPMDQLMLVAGSYGFLYFFRIINEAETEKPLQDIKETKSSQRSKVRKIQGNIKQEVNIVSRNRQMEPDVIGTHQQQKANAPQFGSSLVPDVEAGNLSQTIPGQQKFPTSHPPMLQQQQDLWSTCLSLQKVVNQLQKQLEPLQYNLPAQQQQMPQQQMLSQQELALKSTCSSSQDLLQKLKELMPLIQQHSKLNQQPAAQDCHTQLPAPGSMDPN